MRERIYGLGAAHSGNGGIMRYFKKIVGQRVYLSPINVDDVAIYTKWMNDCEITGNLGNYRQMISLTSEKGFLEKLSTEGHNYAIVLLEGDFLIGNIGLCDIDHVNRKATAGIFIGEPVNRGKGYGSEAMRLLLEYGFKTLNLHNIMLHVNSDNEQAIASYKKAGFREYGRRREAVFKKGYYYDDVHMEALSTEFFGG